APSAHVFRDSRREGVPSPFDDDTDNDFEVSEDAPTRGYGAAAEPKLAQPPVPHEATALTQRPGERTTLQRLLIIGVALLLVTALGVGAWLHWPLSRTGVLQVRSEPDDAQVWIDGRLASFGHSPFVFTDVSAGKEHRIEIRKQGYRTWTLGVTLQPGQQLTLPRVTLRPKAPKPKVDKAARLSVRSAPTGAEVWIDGKKLKQRTPLHEHSLPAGKHHLRLALPGYREWQSHLSLAPDEGMRLPMVQLEARTVTVRVDSIPTGAQVSLSQANGVQKSLGETPLVTTLPANLPPGTLQVERRSYRAWSAPLDLSALQGDTHTVLAELEAKRRRQGRPAVRRQVPAPAALSAVETATVQEEAATTALSPAVPTAAVGTATLRINSQPWSQVFVDGKQVGNTPQLDLKVSPGPHQIRLVNPDFNLEKTIVVQAKAGKTVTRIVKLTGS
ncbi:MAG: PEGA domain-containing protein, partial [Polyangiales bacterium]